MDSFSYTDNARAVFASCLPCFGPPHPGSPSNSPPNAPNTSHPELRSTSAGSRTPPSPNDLEHLLRDPDSDGISLHSNLGATPYRRTRHRRRPKFSLTLFGYTLFGRPPIYLSDEEEENDPRGVGGGRARPLLTNSSSTLDSDAAPLDASTIERRRLEVEEQTRRKAERRARRQERKARERASALVSLTGASPHPDTDAFEGVQESGTGTAPSPLPFHQVAEVAPSHPVLHGPGQDGDFDGSDASHSDADLGGELYARKKKPSGALSGSGSDSRSRTSASFSAGDASHVQNQSIHTAYQSIPYPHTEMHLPAPAGKKPKAHRAPKPASTVSSATSQSTSTSPYTPVESIAETPAVAMFPTPQERYIRDGEHADFPSVGLSGNRRSKSLDPRAFLAN